MRAAPELKQIEKASPQIIASLRGAPTAFKAVALACLNLRSGTMLATLPEGRQLRFGDQDGPTVEIRFLNYAFAKKVLSGGDIGFAESFMDGDWDTPDLPGLLTYLAGNAERIMNIFRGNPLTRAVTWLTHQSRENNKDQARQNILAHYDLGNPFYEKWLDASMTYSAARYQTPHEDLNAAQLRKYRALADQIGLKAGDSVLEIGCGWGGFAEVAARDYGAQVTGLTLSDAQLVFARERMARQGLSGLVDLRLQDYRDVEGQFDKVVSIEMFEAVGERYWPEYFQKINSVLKPGGQAGLQIITIEDRLFDSYRTRADFIQHYVFPGGMLPSMRRLREETDRAGLTWKGFEAFGQSYAKTLAEWAKRFQAAWPEIEPMGFDRKFKALWRFYLGYCEAGFRTGRTDVVQLALSKT